MKRRVIRHGPSTLIFSLPSKWVKEQNVQKGDELDIDIQGDRLVINTPNNVKKVEQVNLDLTDLDVSPIRHYIRSYYRKGYDEMKVNFNNHYEALNLRTEEIEKTIDRINKEVDRLVGVEIIEQKTDYCIIKDISASNVQDFDHVLRRAFLLLIITSSEIVESIKTGDKKILKTIRKKHNTFSKLASFCLRLLNKKGYSEYQKTIILYHIIATLDKIMDVLKYRAEDLIEVEKPSDEIIEIISDIHESLQIYYHFFYKFDPKTTSTLSKQRWKILKQIDIVGEKMSKKELQIIVGYEHIIELLHELSEARVSLTH